MRGRAAALALLCAATLVQAREASSAAAPPCATRTSWTAGSVEWCAGVFVHRDYVHDDYGADTRAADASATGSLSRPAGDQRYAGAANTADIVTVKLGRAAAALRVEVELNALYVADSTLVAVAIDTDNDASTGGGRWHHLPVRSSGWELLYFLTQGDPATNLVTADVPFPAGDRWRVQAAAAIHGSGQVMNVAFRGTSERGVWWEDLQAEALRTGDISAFGAVVEAGRFRAGVTEDAPLEAGVHQRVYTSAHTIPPLHEGMSYAGVPGAGTGFFAQVFHYYGRYQPYGVYVPSTPGPHGVQLALHGHSANHSALLSQRGFQRALGDDASRIIVVPLGRGPAGFYSSWSERDVIDVLDDVIAAYGADRDRVVMGGYSMGGFGTLRLAGLYPDRFAGYVNWVGGTGDCFNGTPAQGTCPGASRGNAPDLAANLRNVPGASLYAGADELVWANHGVALADALRAAGVRHAVYVHPAAEHFTFALLDQWAKEAAYVRHLVRDPRPARVSYRVDPRVQDDPHLGLVHDRAHWVSAIRARGSGAFAVDLHTLACGYEDHRVTVASGAGTDPVPWASQVGAAPPRHGLEARNHLQGSVRNVGSARVDLAAACLTRGPLSYSISTDGPVRVELSDGRAIVAGDAGTHTGVV